MKKFFTSESVTEGHPDKVCDQISDGILDAILAEDPMARAAIECCAAYDQLLIMGEVTTTAKVDYEETARAIIKRIGYDSGSLRTTEQDRRSDHEQSCPILRWASTPLSKRRQRERAAKRTRWAREIRE